MSEDRNRNVILICLDSVRKDYFDKTASKIPELADVSFEQCRTASSWSAPSYASIITGKLPSEHGVHTHSRSYDSVPRSNTIFDNLENHRTVGISANVYAGPEFAFEQYFNSFIELASHIQYPSGINPQQFLNKDGGSIASQLSFAKEALASERPLQSIANGVAGLLRNSSLPNFVPRIVDEGEKASVRALRREIERGEPTFVFVSLMQAHIPHEPAIYLNSDYYDCPRGWSSSTRGVWDLCTTEEYDEQYWERRNQLYRASINYLDRIVARMVSVAETLTERETTIIVTADHGENLGTTTDEGLANHKSSLSEGLLHVPCYLINPPNGYDPKEKEYFSHLQFHKLISGLAESETPDVFRSRIPAELVGMSAGPEPPSEREYWDRMIRCAYSGAQKFAWDSVGNAESYELDPEKQNWQRHVSEGVEIPDWAQQFFDIEIGTYKQTARNKTDAVDVGDATRNRLDELGYI